MSRATATLARAVRTSARGVPISVLVATVCGLAIATAGAATTTTTVTSNNSPRYGRILANSNGHTLYYWCGGTSTRCTATHSASNWSPLIARGRLVVAAHSGCNAHTPIGTGDGKRLTLKHIQSKGVKLKFFFETLFGVVLKNLVERKG